MSGVFIYLLLLIDRSVEYNSELHIPSFSLTTAGGIVDIKLRLAMPIREKFTQAEIFLLKC